jgi:predicted ester cyclase
MGEAVMKHLLTGLLLTFALASTCVADEAENVRVATAMADAINDRDLSALDALVAPNVVRHSASTPGVVVSNLAEFKTFLKSDFATVSDSVQEIDIIFGGGDYVALRARYIGTQDGPMGPFPASGKKLELPFMGILRFEDGKVAEIWVEWDNLFALSQLGHFPPPESKSD